MFDVGIAEAESQQPDTLILGCQNLRLSLPEGVAGIVDFQRGWSARLLCLLTHWNVLRINIRYAKQTQRDQLSYPNTKVVRTLISANCPRTLLQLCKTSECASDPFVPFLRCAMHASSCPRLSWIPVQRRRNPANSVSSRTTRGDSLCTA